MDRVVGVVGNVRHTGLDETVSTQSKDVHPRAGSVVRSGADDDLDVRTQCRPYDNGVGSPPARCANVDPLQQWAVT
jgi:hypothetical protein